MRHIRKLTAPTIEDVALAAGVSISTVSNVLNDRCSRMRPQTLARVQDAIARLGYRPNQAARQLKTGHMQTLGLIVPTIGNPFYATMVRWVEEAAQSHGYGLLLCNTHRSAQREQEYAHALMAQGTQGVIVGTALEQIEHLTPLIERGLAVVGLDGMSHATELPMDYVTMDNHRAGALAAEHLIGLGHRQIAYVTTPLRPVNQMRLDGVSHACQAADAQLAIHIVEPEDDQPDGGLAELGQRAALQLLARDGAVTACVAMNDMLAIGLMAGLREGGVSIPTQMSVIGVDDIPLDQYVTPSLSTVRQPIKEIAAAAVDRVVNRTKHTNDAPYKMVFKPELVIRDSTGAAPKRNNYKSR